MNCISCGLQVFIYKISCPIFPPPLGKKFLFKELIQFRWRIKNLSYHCFFFTDFTKRFTCINILDRLSYFFP